MCDSKANGKWVDGGAKTFGRAITHSWSVVTEMDEKCILCGRVLASDAKPFVLETNLCGAKMAEKIWEPLPKKAQQRMIMWVCPDCFSAVLVDQHPQKTKKLNEHIASSIVSSDLPRSLLEMYHDVAQ